MITNPLKLRYLSFTNHNLLTGINLHSLVQAASYCPNLEYLNISGNKHITNNYEELQTAFLGIFKRLQKLKTVIANDLGENFVKTILNETFEFIGMHPSIETLSFSNSSLGDYIQV